MERWALVAAGSAIGGVLRYALARWFVPVPGAWPVATMTANVVGSFAIGFTAALLLLRAPEHSENLRLFVMTGVLGGFTTYSAFAVETSLLLGGGQTLRALGYVLATVSVCLAAVFAGRACASLLGA
jgi:CrcB protein